MEPPPPLPPDAIPWAAIDALVHGLPLLKFGRAGEPGLRQIRLLPDCVTLEWFSTRKREAQTRVTLAGCGLISGQTTDTFKRSPRAALYPPERSFSLLYPPDDAGGPLRTLDLVAKDRDEHALVVAGLAFLVQGPPPAALLDARRRALWATPAGGGAPELQRKGGGSISRDLKSRLSESCDVFACGAGAWGQLGLGDEARRCEPVLLPALLGRGVRAVACGANHAIALCEGGEAWAFGSGGSGRLGTGSADSELAPRLLLQPPAVAAGGGGGGGGGRQPWRFRTVACGDEHSLGVTLEGAPFAWGCNLFGQLGVLTDAAGTHSSLLGQQGVSQQQQPSPRFVLEPTRVPLFVALALAARGGVEAGQPTQPHAALVATQPVVASVAAGVGYSAFIDAAGRLFTCGVRDAPLGHDRAALGTLLRGGGGVAAARRPPPPAAEPASASAGSGGASLPPQLTAAAVAAADAVLRSFLGPHCDDDAAPSSSFEGPQCEDGIDSEDAADLGGDNDDGRERRPVAPACGIGDGSGWGDLRVPLQVCSGDLHDSGEQVLALSLGAFHAAAASTSGSAFSWGANSCGQLGTGDAVDRVAPTRVLALPRDVVSVACGGAHTLALVQSRAAGDGARCVYACGATSYGQVPAVSHERDRSGSSGGGAGSSGEAAPLSPHSSSSSGGSSAPALTPRMLHLPAAPLPEGEQAPPWSGVGGSGGGGAGAAAGATAAAARVAAAQPRVIAAGFFHSAVICDDGVLYTFGCGESGQTGVSAGAGLAEALKRARANTDAAAAAGGAAASGGARKPPSRLERILSLAKPASSSAGGGALGAAAGPAGAAAGGGAGDPAGRPSSASASPRDGALHTLALTSPAASGGGGGGAPSHDSVEPRERAQSITSLVPASPLASSGITAATESSGSTASSLARRSGRFSFSEGAISLGAAATASTASAGAAASAATANGPAPQQLSLPSVSSAVGGGALGSGRGSSRPAATAVAGASGGAPLIDAFAWCDEEDADAMARGGRAFVSGGDDDLRPRSIVVTAYRNGPVPRRAWGGLDCDEDDEDVAASGGSVFDAATGGSSPTTARQVAVDAASPSALAASHVGGSGGDRQPQLQPPPPSSSSAAALISDVSPAAQPVDWATGSSSAKRGTAAAAAAAVRPPPGGGGGGAAMLRRAMHTSLFVAQRSSLSRSGSVGGEAAAAAADGGGGLAGSAITMPATSTSLPLPAAAAAAATAAAAQQAAEAASPTARSPAAGADGAEQQPIASTLAYGPLPVPALLKREARSVSCGAGFTVVLVATEWMRDAEAPACVRCEAPFSLTLRRHHCRNCGGVVCVACSSRRLPLLRLGYVEPVRVCDGCWGRLRHD